MRERNNSSALLARFCSLLAIRTGSFRRCRTQCSTQTLGEGRIRATRLPEAVPADDHIDGKIDYGG